MRGEVYAFFLICKIHTKQLLHYGYSIFKFSHFEYRISFTVKPPSTTNSAISLRSIIRVLCGTYDITLKHVKH